MYSMVPMSDGVSAAVAFLVKNKEMSRDRVIKQALLNGIYDMMIEYEIELNALEFMDLLIDCREILAELIAEEDE